MTASADRVGHVIDMAAAKGANPFAWRDMLQKDRHGDVQPTLANALIIFNHDQVLKGLCRYNEFTCRYTVMRAAPPFEDNGAELPGPYPRGIDEADVALTQSYLQRVYSPRYNPKVTEQAIKTAAMHGRYHPVRDWLATLRWDGTPRLDTWLIKALGCKDDEYHRAISSKLLLAAVRRVRKPGCKFDHMVIFEGGQGIGKSTVLQSLFGAEWVSDSMLADLKSKDAAQSLEGVWCFEFAEIEHVIRSDVETVKGFLSRAVDRYRKPWGMTTTDFPRQGVLVGTTNDEEYLRDQTGNRRFWPVWCPFADSDWLIANRDQLWAEAAAREASGEAIWLDDADVRELATKEQAARLNEDVWKDRIRLFVAGKLTTTAAQILTDCLNVPAERQEPKLKNRVGGVMRSLGWHSSVIWHNGTPLRVWLSPAHPDHPKHEKSA